MAYSQNGSCVESGWIRGDPVLRKRNEAVRDAVQRTNGAGFNVVHPAVQVQPSLLDSECHRRVGSKVGKLGNDVLSHHGVNARPLGCVLSRFIDGLCGAGVVQPARNSRHMVQALASRDCRHGTAVGVTADDDIGDAKAGDRVLDTSRDASRLHPVGRHDVSGIADDEQFARFLLSAVPV